MKPVLAFDGSILGAGPITGVAGSFLTTLRAYARDCAFDCVLLLPRDAEAPSIDGVRPLPALDRGRWGRLQSLRRACRDVGARLLHSPVTAVPGRMTGRGTGRVPGRESERVPGRESGQLPCPAIATVHDLPWLHPEHPELRGESGARFLRRLAVRFAARTAAALVVPSAATRDDLLRLPRVDPRRVHVIPHGVTPPDWTPPSAPARAGSATSDDRHGPFLVLGDDRPRKNGARLRRAHAAARAKDPGLPDLRFVGPGHGYVPEADKWEILRRARALVHVSLLEGFGLPVLEAFAGGVPVLCSDTTSLPEVAGDAALLVDPRDEAAIGRALLRIHADGELREALRERGIQRAREFTSERSAARWYALHAQVVAAG